MPLIPLNLFFILIVVVPLSLLSGQSTTLENGYYVSFERLDDTSYVSKQHADAGGEILELVTYSTEDKVEKHGLYYKRLEDGTIISQGRYIRDQKKGEWTEKLVKMAEKGKWSFD